MFALRTPSLRLTASCSVLSLVVILGCDGKREVGPDIDAGAVIDAGADAYIAPADDADEADAADGGSDPGDGGSDPGDGGSDPGDGGSDGGPVSTTPTIDEARISGGSICRPFRCEAVGVGDPQGDVVTLRYRWEVGGQVVPYTDATLPAEAVAAGDMVRCVVDATDGDTEGGVLVFGAEVASPALVALDEAPIATTSIPGHIRTGERLTCTVDASDDCDPSLDVTTTWYVDGLVVDTAATLDTDSLAPGAEVRCVATIDDGQNPAITSDSRLEEVRPSFWSLEALTSGGRAGYALAVMDDLDGDGIAELAIGAPDTSSSTATQAGAVYVASGRDRTATTELESLRVGTDGFVIEGTSGSYDLATMGCTPYIVSACPTVRNVGELDGEDTGPAGAGFGAGLAWAGDVDGDGLGELIASAPYELVGNLWRGRTYALSGARLAEGPFAAALDGEGLSISGECGRRRDLDQSKRTLAAPGRATNGDLAGYRVVGVGDANGDGLGDFAVSAPNHGDDDEGAVFLVYGREDEAAVDAGAIYNRGCGATEVSIVGPRDGIDGIAAFAPNEANSASVPARWGAHLSQAGDFDGDGYDDLLVPTGGFGATNVTHILRGGATRRSLRIVNPSPDQSAMWGVLLGNFSYNGTTYSGRWAAGFPSGGGGDVDGDGFDDIAFLGRDFDRDTFLNVLFGRATDNDGTLRTDETVDGSGRGFAVPGSIDLSATAGRVGVVGDLDGDGYDDIAASAISEQSGRGRVYVIFGGPSLAPGVSASSLLLGVGGFVVEGTQNGENLGAELTGGDVDGDGLDDLVIGAPGRDSSAGADAGRVLVVFGHDARDTIDVRGGEGPDVLRGTAAGGAIVGGRGDDRLIGVGEGDVLYGGEGDDVLEVADAAFHRIRGGRGEDTAVLAPGSGDLDLRSARGRIEGIERITLAGQTLSVSAIAALRVSDHARLTISGSSGRLSTTPGDGWVSDGTTVIAAHTYRVLRAGRATLHIETSLDTDIPPTVPNAPWSVPENPAMGQVIGGVAAIDPDGDTGALTFALVADPSLALAIDADTGTLRVIAPSWFDFEAQGEPWSIVVRVTDEAGLVTTTAIPMSVADVNEAPLFPNDAAVWNVEEGTTDVLGNVAAWDVDAGDVLQYSVVTNPGGLFAIDADTGDVTLAAGATLDFEMAPVHELVLGATDLGGLAAVRTVTLNVGDIDVVERDLRVTFDVRGWSMRDDDFADTSAGLEVFGLTTQGQTEYCYTVPSTDALHTENFSTSWTNGWPSAPLSFEAEVSGTFCASTSVEYDEGTWNATVPVDIHLGIPDEVTPGSTFTLQSSATPIAEGAGFWGTSPGLEFSFGMRLADVDVHLAGCDSLFSHTCAVAVDRRSIYTSFRDSWGTETYAWTGGLLDDPGRFVLTVQAPIVVDSQDIVINWDDYWVSIAKLMGLPSNEGSFEYHIGGQGSGSGMVATMQYELFNTDVVFRSEAASVIALEVLGVDGMITFENGDTVPFRLGTPQDVTVPLDGDIDADGDVDVSVTFFLDASYTNEFEHAERAGYALSGGFGRTRVVNVAGDVLSNRRFGPALEHLCAPRVGNAQIPVTCFTSGEARTIAYRPSGFVEPRILGSLDLGMP